MGSCFCKDKIEDGDPYEPSSTQNCSNGEMDRSCERKQMVLATTVNKLVLETLGIIGSIVDNEQEPPSSMVLLHSIADKEAGWIQVVESMVDVIPMDHPLGPSVITLLLDDCPLPSRDSVVKVAKLFGLSSNHNHTNNTKQRNICVILGCIAEKLAGPSSVAILSEDTLEYLTSNLSDNKNPHVVLFSLIALEKFAQTSENKATIKKKLLSLPDNPLNKLEKLAKSSDCVQRQVGFCARWSLDNLFVTEDRQYSFETVDNSGINVMLNTRDVSEYLKISPDGLEARCDAYSFESVRCTFQVDSGIWYYETLIITSGVMQIGWATKSSSFLNHEGYGIGDDPHSLAYDGCRRLIWHNARSESQSLSQWRSGSILGCLLDLDNKVAIFSVDGICMEPCTQLFAKDLNGFFAAASFMSFQQCRFNFGSEPFMYPPTDRSFRSFNETAIMLPEDKVVLPRHIFLEQLRKLSVREDSCTLCFDKIAIVRLDPCGHRGFCSTCANQLSYCPMCRGPINSRMEEES